MANRWSLGGWGTASKSRAGVYVSATQLAVVKQGPTPGAATRAWRVRSLESAANVESELRAVVTELGLRKAECVLTLPFSEYALLQVEKPNVPEAELLAATRWRVRDMLSFPVDEAVVDAFEVPGMESRGRPPSLMVAAARRSELSQKVDLLRAVGLRPVAIGVGEIALRRLAGRMSGAGESLALIMVGHAAGSLVVVNADTLFVSRRIELDPGELRALSAGEAGQSQRERIFERLALELQRTGDYFDSTYQRAPLRKALIVTDDPAFNALPVALRNALGMEAQVLDPAAALGAEGAGPAELWPLTLAVAGAWQEAA